MPTNSIKYSVSYCAELSGVYQCMQCYMLDNITLYYSKCTFPSNFAFCDFMFIIYLKKLRDTSLTQIGQLRGDITVTVFLLFKLKALFKLKIRHGRLISKRRAETTPERSLFLSLPEFRITRLSSSRSPRTRTRQ